jgi:hypothetical protein
MEVFMRRIARLTLTLWVLGHPLSLTATAPVETSAAAATRDTSPPSQTAMLHAAIAREATRWAIEVGRTRRSTTQSAASQSRGWIERHATLSGAVVGAGVGTLSSIPRWNELYCAGGGDEDCLFHGGLGVLFGAGAGAGVGALIGFLVGR